MLSELHFQKSKLMAWSLEQVEEVSSDADIKLFR